MVKEVGVVELCPYCSGKRWSGETVDLVGRIQELEAEVKRLKADTWQPVADGTYACRCGVAGCTAHLIVAHDDEISTIECRDGDESVLVELPATKRLCERRAPAQEVQ